MAGYDYDYLIIGSGFGGAVSALRLAEKGWRVGVVEQGRRIGPAEMAAGKRSARALLWMPRLGLRGYFVQHFFRHLGVVGGVGVGGGSIVWGAVMLEPSQGFYDDPVLARLGLDLKAELAPHYATAKRMLGVITNPRQTKQDGLLQVAAVRMGVSETFGPVSSAIYFGERGVTKPDPYFDGHGPARAGCRFCGGCLTGCEFGSKNSLDLNYLYLAEQRGVTVMPERKASRIEPLPEGGYRVVLVSAGSGRVLEAVTARRVIVAAGVIGTLELLFENRDRFGTLPRISATLGRLVRTNSEAITAVLHAAGTDMSDGTAISTHFFPDAHTHITQNRFDRGYRFMRIYMGPLVDDPVPWRRALRTLLAMARSLPLLARNLFARAWEKRLSVLSIMQDHESRVALRYRRHWWWPFKRSLASEACPGHQAPSYLPVANQVAREVAAASGGTPMNILTESLAGLSTTAHILSGCPMGRSADDGVIDTRHEVHGHPGLFVVDGSSIPANVGVNPSLTIAAMAERFAALQPAAPAPTRVATGR